jgi:hypothetical protein
MHEILERLLLLLFLYRGVALAVRKRTESAGDSFVRRGREAAMQMVKSKHDRSAGNNKGACVVELSFEHENTKFRRSSNLLL